ncbi:GatB/YqeY domain-containing protein [Longimicrobium sp.]|uniref:GatB/YqeY domain-containing protein n=1 Tax=Longimicrobium sp. TaxID=2029185 RepID=UPI002E365A3F|nr:GatB/YqeY domain-containing protein [Longimicrobium sp.]HEX6037196.1 GatB/YqeY domain-containing protein [Longimicrobium sp.]
MPDPTLVEQLRADLMQARKDRDKLRTTTLTTFLAEIKNKEIDQGGPVSDEDVRGLLVTAIKRRREAAEQMRAGNRAELAEKEEQEGGMLQAYLPPALGEDEVRGFIAEAIAGGAKDVGGVMKAVMPRAKGRFDGKELNRLVREALAG